MSWCGTDGLCSAGTRTLTLLSALPEAKEVCGTISTEDGRRINGRTLWASRDGRSPGRGAGPHAGANGEGGDIAHTRSRIGRERAGMIFTRKYIGRRCQSTNRGRVSLTYVSSDTYTPVTKASPPLSVPFTFALFLSSPSFPPNELSLVCGLSSLVDFIRHRA